MHSDNGNLCKRLAFRGHGVVVRFGALVTQQLVTCKQSAWPLVINEIMYNPTSGDSEYLEFLSITNGPLNISGWAIAGTSFTFPTSTIVPANGLVLLLKTNTTSVAAFRSNYSVPMAVPIFAADFVLENEGEALRIDKPNVLPTEPMIQIERIRYNDKSPWPTEADGEGPSLERYSANQHGNDPINWRTVLAGGSPGRLNVFNAGVAIAKNSAWNYQASGANLGTPWREFDYSDSGWPDGDGSLGYGAAGLATLIPFGANPTNKPITVYLRKEFVINDAISNIFNLQLDAMYDDGFVVYLNGTEVLRSASMPDGAIAYNTPATNYNSLGYETFDLSAQKNLLRSGNNVLSVEVHQVNASSDDLLWDASLTFDVSTLPTVATPVITPAGGTFTNAVQVSMASTPTNAAIYYTLNGTLPDESSPLYTGPFNLGTSTEVRARAYRPGYNESGVAVAVFTIGAPGVLDVTPGSGLAFVGTTGGPFTAASSTYTLTNSGGLPVSWSVGISQNWLTPSIASGTVTGGDADNVVFSINANGDNLPAGNHNAVAWFTNLTSGTQTSRAISLTVNPIVIAVGQFNAATGTFELTLQGHSNSTYVIEASTNLTQWSAVATNIAGAGGLWTYVETNSFPRRFYRGKPQR